jgi:hypothetical protein
MAGQTLVVFLALAMAIAFALAARAIVRRVQVWRTSPLPRLEFDVYRQFFAALFIRGVWAIFAFVFSILGLLALLRDEFPENEQAGLFLRTYAPNWGWQVWVIVLCVVLIVLISVAFFRFFAAVVAPLRQQYVISRFFWAGRELQRKCSKRKRVWNDAQDWGIQTNRVVSQLLGAGYGVRFKADWGTPNKTAPQGVKDTQTWDYLERRLFKLHEIIEELTNKP